MDYWQTATGISRLERIGNERVREIMRVVGNKVENIRKKQLIRYDHVKEWRKSAYLSSYWNDM
jgi:hypothetical protein